MLVAVEQTLSMVSIHAPREGCDIYSSCFSARSWAFQFTHPGRGATMRTSQVGSDTLKFQFTHPGRGATNSRGGAVPWTRVSIHAPREGCDDHPRGELALMPSFNSRTPGGVRRNLLASVKARNHSFNSRTPGGVRQVYSVPHFYTREFQFTHPGRGATINSLHDDYISKQFQFTHPGRGATALRGDHPTL